MPETVHVSEDRSFSGVQLIVRTVTSWDAARIELSYFDDRWILRGHREESWGLRCNLDRKRGDAEAVDAEARVRAEFEPTAHLYLSNIREPQSTMEWLALIQHHGGPTRLMDFTRAPMVAAFFALEDEGQEDNCAVWAVKEDACRVRAAKRLGKIDSAYAFLQSHHNLEEAVSKQVFRRPPQRFLAPVQPSRMNVRMVWQQGMFLCFGDPGSDLFANLTPADDYEEPVQVVKLVFPRRDRGRALAELRRSNISRETLFPGLDGLGRSIEHLFVRRDHEAEALLGLLAKPSGWPGASS